MELDFSKRYPEERTLSRNDLKFLSTMKEDIHHRTNQHLEMPLLFEEEETNLPENRVLALHRLKQLKNRFKKNPQYKDYTTFMEEVFQKGHAERVPDHFSDASTIGARQV